MEELPGILVRAEGAPASGDVAVDEAYDGLGATYDFFWKVFDRNSIDDEGLSLDATVHFGENYENAFACSAQTDQGALMRIEFLTEGGVAQFPGLSRPVTIDSEQLTQREGAELKRLVEAADFFNLPASVGTPARGAADYRQYTLTIEEGARRHTVRATEPVDDTDLRSLLAFVRTQSNQLRRSTHTPP